MDDLAGGVLQANGTIPVIYGPDGAALAEAYRALHFTTRPDPGESDS